MWRIMEAQSESSQEEVYDSRGLYSKARLPSQAWFAEKTQVSVDKEKA